MNLNCNKSLPSLNDRRWRLESSNFCFVITGSPAFLVWESTICSCFCYSRHSGVFLIDSSFRAADTTRCLMIPLLRGWPTSSCSCSRLERRTLLLSSLTMNDCTLCFCGPLPPVPAPFTSPEMIALAGAATLLCSDLRYTYKGLCYVWAGEFGF